MNIIKRKLYKHLTTSRKNPIVVIDLESLGLKDYDDTNLDEIVHKVSNRVIHLLDIDIFYRVMRYSAKLSKRRVLSKEKLEVYLLEIIQEILYNYIMFNEDNIFIDGEHLGGMLFSNGSKHSLTLYPKVDLPK